jgi:hypothetical protein
VAVSAAQNPPTVSLSKTVKTYHQLKTFIPSLLCILLSGALVGVPSRATAQETKTNSVPAGESKPDKPKTVATAKKAELPPRKLSGAELYSMHCNRCHPERYPTERTAAQWKTILLHMRVRANLPAEQARTILQYLQENSGR